MQGPGNLLFSHYTIEPKLFKYRSNFKGKKKERRRGLSSKPPPLPEYFGGISPGGISCSVFSCLHNSIRPGQRQKEEETSLCTVAMKIIHFKCKRLWPPIFPIPQHGGKFVYQARGSFKDSFLVFPLKCRTFLPVVPPRLCSVAPLSRPEYIWVRNLCNVRYTVTFSMRYTVRCRTEQEDGSFSQWYTFSLYLPVYRGRFHVFRFFSLLQTARYPFVYTTLAWGASGRVLYKNTWPEPHIRCQSALVFYVIWKLETGESVAQARLFFLYSISQSMMWLKY